MKSYITRQFKKFMKNANMKDFDKDREIEQEQEHGTESQE